MHARLGTKSWQHCLYMQERDRNLGHRLYYNKCCNRLRNPTEGRMIWGAISYKSMIESMEITKSLLIENYWQREAKTLRGERIVFIQVEVSKQNLITRRCHIIGTTPKVSIGSIAILQLQHVKSPALHRLRTLPNPRCLRFPPLLPPIHSLSLLTLKGGASPRIGEPRRARINRIREEGVTRPIIG